jgi:SAM-dependent methyltransferase
MFGVDVNPALVRKAVEKGYTAYASPAEELRFEDGVFDVVVVSELLEHAFDPRPVLDEAHRVLRLGGLLLGDVPTEMGRWGLETIADHAYHARVFTHDSLHALLSARFRIDTLRGVPSEDEHHEHFDIPTWYVFRCTKAR